jgi:diguanylate cyclase (GGDEF)-like protein
MSTGPVTQAQRALVGSANGSRPTGDAVGEIAAEAALLGAGRGRMARRFDGHDRRSGLITGGSFLILVGAWLAIAPPVSVPFGMLAACIAVYVAAGSVEFEIGPGSAVPTMPVQVVMLFVLPAQLVPVAAVCGLWGAGLVGRLRDPERAERGIVLAGSGWQVVGPAVVFAVAHAGTPAVHDIPVYALALIAQLAFDFAAAWVRNCYGFGVCFSELARALRFTFLCDLLLAPMGLAAVLALPHSPGAFLLLLSPTVLLAILQSDRQKQIDKTVALGAAFADTSHLARRDALTGLANRLAWEEVTAGWETSDQPVGVVLADVDGLKAANDLHGHAMGDRLLIAVANVLSRATSDQPDAIVARIGGDEFAVLVPGASMASTHRLRSRLRQAFELEARIDGVVVVSASVGAGFAHHGYTLGRAIAAADRGVNINKDARGVRRRASDHALPTA